MFTIPGLAELTQSGAKVGEIAIIGDGNRSLAVGAILSLAGHNVRLCSQADFVPGECEIRQRRARVGHIRGKSRFAVVTADIGQAVKGASCIISKTPATKYDALIQQLAPGLSNGQMVVLCNAPLGAALEFSRLLLERRGELQVNVLETGRLFDAVKVEGEVVLAKGPRKRVSICGLTRNETRRGLALASNVWMGLVPASNVLERGFSDVERILRPCLQLCRLLSSRWSRDHLSDNLTPAAWAIIANLDDEIQSLARAYKLVVPGFTQLLTDYCEARGGSLIEQISGLGEVLLPEDTDIAEDVKETLVLIEELARLVRVPVPVIDSIIELASSISGSDLRKDGRGLNRLGLVGFDASEIMEMVNA